MCGTMVHLYAYSQGIQHVRLLSCQQYQLLNPATGSSCACFANPRGEFRDVFVDHMIRVTLDSGFRSSRLPPSSLSLSTFECKHQNTTIPSTRSKSLCFAGILAIRWLHRICATSACATSLPCDDTQSTAQTSSAGEDATEG